MDVKLQPTNQHTVSLLPATGSMQAGLGLPAATADGQRERWV